MRELISGGMESWASFFANHGIVRTLIGFMHIGGLLASGGCAVAADRATLLARRLGVAERRMQLGSLKGLHRIVIGGLALIVISGVLLWASDFETYLYSKLFWTKMTLFGLLLANGALLIRAERQAEGGSVQAWSWLILTSKASIALWFLTTLAGTGLLNIG
jgi:hypothetical protein